MRLNKFIKLFLIIILCLMIQSIVLVNKSNATAESNRTTSGSSKTINGAFEQCYEMRNPTSSLGYNKLDPHLATPRDMGMAIFLGLSSYGATNGTNSPLVHTTNTTNPIISNQVSATSTTGNMSGIMKIGVDQEWMAAVTPELVSDANTSLLFDSKYNRYLNMVTGTSVEETRGMPLAELTRDDGKYFFENTTIGYSRDKLLVVWNIGGRVYNTQNNATAKYRPVIWN